MRRAARGRPRAGAWCSVSPLAVVLAAALACLAPGLVRAQAPATTPPDAARREVFARYCVSCHTEAQKSRGAVPVAIDLLDLTRVGADAAIWERVVLKIRAGVMPPAGMPRPDRATLDNLAGWLESQLDAAAAAHPNPGRTEPLHRLNRAEYRNAMRDLLGLDLDVSPLLPPDDSSYGFDNIAGVLKLSPTLMERYLSAALKVSRLAVGSAGPSPAIDYFRVADDLAQDRHVEGLPLGTRGGTAVGYVFPMDGEYEFRPRLARDLNESVPLYNDDQVVARGANVNARMTKEPKDGNRNMLNRIGATPFLMAAKSDDVALMRTLLEVGADASLTTQPGTTAVMAAAGVGIWAPGENPGTHEEALAAVKLALDAGGGHVNAVDQEGETALHGAVYRGGAIPVIRFLLDRGAALDVVNKRGWTPLVAAEGVEYTPAVLKRYPEAADLLRRAARERPAAAAPSRAQNTGAAAPPKTIWDGAFTEGQAARGQERYRTACAACHAEDLLGAQGPALVGQAFLDRWNGSAVLDMVQVIKQSMPQEAPDSLGLPAYVDIVSYLLKSNGGPAGASELPTENAALRQILVTSHAASR